MSESSNTLSPAFNDTGLKMAWVAGLGRASSGVCGTSRLLSGTLGPGVEKAERACWALARGGVCADVGGAVELEEATALELRWSSVLR